MTKLDDLIKKIKEFNKARGWTPVSSDIAKSVVIEASELLEHFQWDESDRNIKGTQPKNKEKIGEEVADIFWYLITFCHSTNINLEQVVEDKITKNEKKYPAKMFNGKHNDKFYKEQKRKYRDQRQKI